MADHDFTRTEIRVLFRMLTLSISSIKFLAGQLQAIASHKALTPAFIKNLNDTVKDVEKYIEKARPE